MSQEQKCKCKNGIRGNGCMDYHGQEKSAEEIANEICSVLWTRSLDMSEGSAERDIELVRKAIQHERDLRKKAEEKAEKDINGVPMHLRLDMEKVLKIAKEKQELEKRVNELEKMNESLRDQNTAYNEEALRYEARIKALEEALKPFADLCSDDTQWTDEQITYWRPKVRQDDVLRAKQALSSEGKDGR